MEKVGVSHRNSGYLDDTAYSSPYPLETAKSHKILAIASTLPKAVHSTGWEDTLVDTSHLDSEEHPACILALLQSGGATSLGTFDKSSLTLRSYTNARGMAPEEADAFVNPLIEHSDSPVETTKGIAEKWRHWLSTATVPSAQAGFYCASILKARKELGFRCKDCLQR